MKEHNFHLWSSRPILETIKLENPIPGDIINIFACEEYEIDPDWTSGKYYDYIDDNALRLTLVVGSGDYEFYKNTYFNYSRYNVIQWKTFFLNQTYVELKNLKYRFKPNRLFISMNAAPRYHRCMMFDNFFKNNLDQDGFLIWHGSVDKYEWKWWQNPTHLTMSKKINYQNVNTVKWQLPKQFFGSLVSVVSESSDNNLFLTEKTAIPLFLEKPLLVQGSKGFHKYLTSLGFKLYDDIFDYSFDDRDTIEERTQGIIDNLLRLKGKDYSKLYEQCKETASYNRNKVIEIVKDSSTIPDIIKLNSFAKNTYRRILREL